MAQGGSGGGGGSKWGGTALFMAAAAAGGCAAAYAAYRYAWQPRRIGFVRHITLAGGREVRAHLLPLDTDCAETTIRSQWAKLHAAQVIGLDAEWEPDGSNPKVPPPPRAGGKVPIFPAGLPFAWCAGGLWGT